MWNFVPKKKWNSAAGEIFCILDYFHVKNRKRPWHFWEFWFFMFFMINFENLWYFMTSFKFYDFLWFYDRVAVFCGFLIKKEKIWLSQDLLSVQSDSHSEWDPHGNIWSHIGKEYDTIRWIWIWKLNFTCSGASESF
jgi:hypothetical protein